MAEMIRYVLEHYDKAIEMGSIAHQKCIQKYSWTAMEAILSQIYNE